MPSYLVFDFETSGVGKDSQNGYKPYKPERMPLPRANYPVQLAAEVLDENGDKIAAKQLLITGAVKFDPWVVRNCPHLSVDECNRHGVCFADAIRELAEMVDAPDFVLVAHNMQYDWNDVMLCTARELQLEDMPAFRKLASLPRRCTCVNDHHKRAGTAYYFAKIERWVGPSLASLAQECGVEYLSEKAHDAAYDVRVTSSCLRHALGLELELELKQKGDCGFATLATPAVHAGDDEVAAAPEPIGSDDYQLKLYLHFVEGGPEPVRDVVGEPAAPSPSANQYLGHVDDQVLARRNSHPYDSRIKFYEADHIYELDGVKLDLSVSGLWGRYFKHFEPGKTVDKYYGGWKAKSTSRYYSLIAHLQTECGLDDTQCKDAICHMWELNGNAQSGLGTVMHRQIELFLNSEYTADFSTWRQKVLPQSAWTPELDHFAVWLEAEIKTVGWIPYRTEHSVFHKDAMLAGQIDSLWVTPEGKLVMVDWKRCKSKIRRDEVNRFDKWGIGVCSTIPNTNYGHYMIQQNAYKYILKICYGIEVDKMYLAQFHPLLNEYNMIEVEDQYDILDAMFKARIAEVRRDAIKCDKDGAKAPHPTVSICGKRSAVAESSAAEQIGPVACTAKKNKGHVVCQPTSAEQAA